MTIRLAVLLVALLGAGPVLAGQQAECNKRACDLDRDGHGSLLGDYAVMFASFGKTRGEPGFDPRADLDGDGAVTSTDFGLLQKFCPLGQ